jgi:hypothetical protein
MVTVISMKKVSNFRSEETCWPNQQTKGKTGGLVESEAH